MATETRISSEQAKEAIYQAHLSKDAIEKINGLQASASKIDGKVFSHPQLTSFLYNLNNPNRNMSILCVSDSTGDSNSEFIYLTAEWIANNFNINVRFRYWNNTTNKYDSAILINTGNTYYLDIFNFAVSGSTSYYIQGVNKATKAFKEITNPLVYPSSSSVVDLILFNHGHNLDETNMGIKGLSLMFGQTVEELISFHPYAGVLVIKQTPNTLLSNETKIRNIVDYAVRRGFCVIDFWQKFIDLNMDASLYKDFQHPSDYGNEILAGVLINYLNKKVDINNTSTNRGIMLNKGINYLKNGCFNVWSNTSLPPDEYQVSGGTAIKDTTKYDSRKGYSVKFTATSTSAYFGIASLSSGFDHLKGKTVVLAVRLLVDDSTGLEAGHIGISTDTTLLQATPQGKSNGSWVWRFYPLNISINDSVLRARVYLVGSSGTSIYIDRMVLCLGELPYDAD